MEDEIVLAPNCGILPTHEEAPRHRDGIDPREQRPRRLNTNWGGVIETNAFGTHEFMDLAEQIGAAPYISANVGTGTPQEMKDWIEYMTSDSDSDLASRSAKPRRDTRYRKNCV